jgi:hypothetical protein
MNEENYVDGLLYEIRNPQYNGEGQIISTEISARSDGWSSYSDSSERMMNRICHHLNPDLVPDYCPSYEHLRTDADGREFVSELQFNASKKL